MSTILSILIALQGLSELSTICRSMLVSIVAIVYKWNTKTASQYWVKVIVKHSGFIDGTQFLNSL